jgi:hypothetical protein
MLRADGGGACSGSLPRCQASEILAGIALGRRFSEREFDFFLESFVAVIPLKERSSRVDMSNDSVAIKEEGYRRPASILVLQPPAAQRPPFWIDGNGKLKTQLARHLFNFGNIQRLVRLMMIEAENNESPITVPLPKFVQRWCARLTKRTAGRRPPADKHDLSSERSERKRFRIDPMAHIPALETLAD